MADKNRFNLRNEALMGKKETPYLQGSSLLTSNTLLGHSSLLSKGNDLKHGSTSGIGSKDGSSWLMSSPGAYGSSSTSSLSLQTKLNLSSKSNLTLDSSKLLSSSSLVCQSTLKPTSSLEFKPKSLSKYGTTPCIESGLHSLSITKPDLVSEVKSVSRTTQAQRTNDMKTQLKLETTSGGGAKKRGLSTHGKIEKKKKTFDSGGVLTAQVIKYHTIEAPDYFIQCENEEDNMEIDVPKFVPPSNDLRLAPSVGRSLSDVVGIKRGLINCVSGSLISQPNFSNTKDQTRQQLTDNVMCVVHFDPEFILKVALYSRKELNIRTTSNFLLALAANVNSCRPYLKKYFSACVALPSDWIEVAEIFQTLEENNLKLGALPAALRKAMISKFPEFDQYQLAKYNKEKSINKKKKALNAKKTEAIQMKKRGSGKKKVGFLDSDSSDGESDEDNPRLMKQLSTVSYDEKENEETLRKQRFTIKQLIRKLHIKEPAEPIMCIIGKKYPASSDEFYRCRLPGTFEEEKAGKRMKLPVPETWETQVSLKGNKAQTWEDLIDHKKLPFMAMLRNLRNLIKAGISPKHHNNVLRRLCDQRQVVNSKQFPFRFFSAYAVLQELEENYEKNQRDIVEQAEVAEMMAACGGGGGAVHKTIRGGIQRVSARGRGRGSARGRGRGRGRGASDGAGENQWWKIRKMKKREQSGKISEVPYDKNLIQRYRKALDTAVKIATVHNVQPIKGRTILMCDIGENMHRPCSSAKGLGKPRMIDEVSALMGLMCKYSCEDCELIVYRDDSYRVIQLKSGTILDNVDAVLNCDMPPKPDDMVDGMPYKMLFEKLRDRVQVDNLLVFGENFYPDTANGRVVGDFLRNYRHLVNPNLLFVSVAFSSPKAGFVVNVKPEHDNDIYISGYSDAILRFIAERGDAGLIQHVDKIDEAFHLRPMPHVKTGQRDSTAALPEPETALHLRVPTPSWKTIRVFISSTFRDMHGERDLLTRFVFPELRAMAKKHFINVYEVDLRWGVTEKEAHDNRTVSLCLEEISRCQLFIGILGERYGWTPQISDIPDTPEFDWARQYPAGASLTELEMHLGALSKPKDVKDTAFFFLRDKSFQTDVPPALHDDFMADTEVQKSKMAALKKRIRNSGLEVYDNYPCRWGGFVDGKPLVSGLEDLGARLLNTMINAVKKLCPEENEVMTEDALIDSQHWAVVERCCAEFVGRNNLLKQAVRTVTTMPSGIIGLVGKPGCGKTALMASTIMELVKSNSFGGASDICINLCGAAPGSTSLSVTVRRIALQINLRFGLAYNLPEDFKNLIGKLPDLLKEAATMCTSKLVIFMDGIDMMDSTNQPFNLEWLPKPCPENVIFVLTALEKDKTHQALKRLGAAELNVGGMDMWDKAELVRQTLAKHRKSLDETGFGNQMKLLMLKKDAHNPLYLKLACEELRVFGVFEKISDKLKSLPHTTAQILQAILDRLEADHGAELVCTALCLLTCVRDGLYPEELYELLSWYKFLDRSGLKPGDICNRDLETKDHIPPMTFTFLARSIMSFLNPSSTWSPILSLANSEITTAIRLRYLKGTAENEIYLHKLLAEFFQKNADPMNDGTWSSQNTRAISELPYHLASGDNWTDLEKVLCSHAFIQAKCSLGLAAGLMDDFKPKAFGNKASEIKQSKFWSQKSVEQYKSFVSRNMEILVNYPSLEWQQAMNEPSDSIPCQDANKLCFAVSQVPPYMEWSNKPREENPCIMTLSNFKDAATCIAVSSTSHMFATGSMDFVVRLYDAATSKELRCFVGHSDSITDICFVGANTLCSASLDTTLSLWDVDNGHRIHTLKSHSRRVNSCASNRSGQIVASGGWDCKVYLWKTNNAEKFCEFDVGSPVNSVDFHPSEELVVVGSWDSLIRIYNFFHKTRVAILRGHSTSVRDVAYSVDGRHLASAALDGDVNIWSADKGSQVGSVKGHAGPVNKLRFSPTGKELITAGEDHQVKVWSGDLGIPVHCLTTEGKGSATSVCISPKGLTLAAGYHLGQVCIYDVNTGVKVVEAKLCACAVRALTFSPDGNYILAGCDDSLVHVLEGSQGTRICSLIGHSKPVLCVTVTKNYVATAGEDFTCCVYENLKQLKSVKQSKPSAVLGGHIAPVTSCTFNGDESMLATASRDASVRIYSTFDIFLSDDPKPKQILHACHADWINASQWSNTGDFLVTASNDFNLKLWDTKNAKEKLTLSGHSSAINSVAYKYGCIVSGSTDGNVKIWSHKGVEITTLRGHNLRVNACDIYVKCTTQELDASDEDEELSWAQMAEAEEKKQESKKIDKDHQKSVNVQDVLVASAGDDGTVWIWRPLRAHSLACLSGHSDRVLSVSASKDSKVVSCSLDRSLRLWQLTLRDEIDVSKHDAPVTFMAVNNSGDMAISGSRDGVLKLWKLDSEKLFHVKHTFQAHGKSVNCGVFDVSNPSRFLTGGDDNSIQTWLITERKDGFFVRCISSLATDMPVSSIACTRTGRYFFTCWSGRVFAAQGNNCECVFSIKGNGTLQVRSGLAVVNHWPTTLSFNAKDDKELVMGTTRSSFSSLAVINNQLDVASAEYFISTDDVDCGIEEVKRPLNWVNCVVKSGAVAFCGDSRGQLTIDNKGLKSTTKIHKSAITSLEVVENIIITASSDCSIKIWEFSPLNSNITQIGQFFNLAPVTSLKTVKATKKLDRSVIFLVAGDQLGHIQQLVWRSSLP